MRNELLTLVPGHGLMHLTSNYVTQQLVAGCCLEAADLVAAGGGITGTAAIADINDSARCFLVSEPRNNLLRKS